MSLIRSLSTLSVAAAVLFVCSSVFADVEPGNSSDAFGTDEGLGAATSDLIQDLDAQPNMQAEMQPNGDLKQLSELLQQKIETAQARQMGDEQVSEPVGDDL
jgi:hypothetical protein